MTVSTQMPLRWTDSEIGYAAAWPDGDRTTSALSSRWKSTNSSAITATSGASPANGISASAADSSRHTPLPS